MILGNIIFIVITNDKTKSTYNDTLSCLFDDYKHFLNRIRIRFIS